MAGRRLLTPPCGQVRCFVAPPVDVESTKAVSSLGKSLKKCSFSLGERQRWESSEARDRTRTPLNHQMCVVFGAVSFNVWSQAEQVTINGDDSTAAGDGSSIEFRWARQ